MRLFHSARLGALSWLLIAWSVAGVAVAGMGPFGDAAAAEVTEVTGTDSAAAISSLNAGAAALKNDQFKAAVRYFTAAIESGTLSLEGVALAYHHRGIAQQKLGLTGAAVADYTKAIWQGSLPSDVLSRSYYNRGIAYAEMGEFERAERDYSSAIELNQTYASAYHNRANLRRGRGAYQEAIDDYNSALAHLDGAGKHLPLYGRALAKEALGDKKGAIADLYQTLEAKPDYDLASAKLMELEPAAVTASVRPTPALSASADPAPAASSPPAYAGANAEAKAIAAETGPGITDEPGTPETDMPKQNAAGKIAAAEPEDTHKPGLWETIVTRFTAPGLRAAVGTPEPVTVSASTPNGQSELRPSETDEEPAGDLVTGTITPSTDTPRLAGPAYAAETPPAPAARADEPAARAEEPAAATGDLAASKTLERPYRIQIGSFRSVQEAEKAWGRIGKPHAALVSGLQPYIAEADLGERGLYYRLQLGPFSDKREAGTLCGALKERRVDCYIVRP